MANVNGRFFNLTIDEKPARHALDHNSGKQIWDMSMQMTGLINNCFKLHYRFMFLALSAASFPVKTDIGRPEGLNVH